MKASAIVLISGNANAWKVAEESDPVSTIEERAVSLEIRGDATNGFHLIVSPSGCFTADSWHETIDDAIDTAHRLFDVRPDAWI